MTGTAPVPGPGAGTLRRTHSSYTWEPARLRPTPTVALEDPR